jgi:probable addiction module antidote protein
MSALARETGIKRETLYAALGEGGNPTFETLLAVINALGLQLGAEVKATAEQREPEMAG